MVTKAFRRYLNFNFLYVPFEHRTDSSQKQPISPSQKTLNITKPAKHAGCFQSGVTLIELILSMVIISIAVTGVFSVINITVSHSADPVVQHQAIAIAEAYLEEITLHSVVDPDGTNTGETRSSYDNVADYNGLNDTGAHNQQGVLLNSLSAYNVSVTVVDQTVSALAAKKITVTVSGPGESGLSLVGYKFDY